MKKVFLIFAFVLILSLLTGCVNFEKIDQNFEAAGYTYSQEANDLMDAALQSLEESDVQVSVHVYTLADLLSSKIAVILEFDTSKELKEQVENNEDIQALLGKLEEKDLIRGNFLLIPIALSSTAIQDMVDTFND
ncbi:MAG: hypothetical protein PHT56_05130 [Candidatus Izemoplasmatales bacterium]|nr:hypothetical protein [Candidatus Izemoplasmatales bacterium]